MHEHTDITEAVPIVLTEAQLAEWHTEGGQHVVESRGRFWHETSPGFYQCLHYMACLSHEEAHRPTLRCWGFRTSLRGEDAGTANAARPLCILRNLADYDESALRRSVRQDLNKGRRNARYVRLTNSELLREQGHEIYQSASKRIGSAGVRGRDQYLDRLKGFADDPRRLVVGALVGNRLAGYCDATAVDGYGYGWNVYVGTQYLSLNVTIGLQFETVQAFRRTGKVTSMVNGPHTPENPSLMQFKERLGFEVVPVPSRLWMIPPALSLLKHARPLSYYRLTGRTAAEAHADS